MKEHGISFARFLAVGFVEVVEDLREGLDDKTEGVSRFDWLNVDKRGGKLTKRLRLALILIWKRKLLN